MKVDIRKKAAEYIDKEAPYWLRAEEEDRESAIEEFTKFTEMILRNYYPETRKCYCGNPVDLSNPDCTAYNLCKDHASDV